MNSTVLVLGEALIDVVRSPDGDREIEHVGGSAANAAVALARLGHPTLLATALGEDARGHRIAALLEAEGVAWAVDPYVLERTSVALAQLNDEGVATYSFDIEWRLAEPSLTAVPTAVLVSSLGPTVAPGNQVVRSLVEALGDSPVVVYDINLRPAITGTGPHVVAAVESMASLSHLIKASDEDLEGLYPGSDEAAAAHRLLGLGASAVVVTRGSAGAVWYAGDGVVEAPAVRVDVVDTIGAGDTFGAAIIDAVVRSGCRDLTQLTQSQRHQALHWATRAAAINVGRSGANPPTRQELEA